MYQYHRVGLAVVQDGGLLMVRNKDSRFWSIPGGHIEDGETPREALERELKEELSVDLKADSFHVAGRFSDRHAESGEEFQLTLCLGDIVGTPTPSAEIGEYIWFEGSLPDGELPPMFVNHVQPALVRTLEWQATREQ